MDKKVARQKTDDQSKIVKIQKIYGPDSGKADLEEASKYLKSIGFKSLGDLLEPANN